MLCRLCLKTIGKGQSFKFLITEDLLLSFLVNTVPGLDLTISPNPVACKNCQINLRAAYSFRLRCLRSQKLIDIFIRETKSSGYIFLEKVHEYWKDQYELRTNKGKNTDPGKNKESEDSEIGALIESEDLSLIDNLFKDRRIEVEYSENESRKKSSKTSVDPINESDTETLLKRRKLDSIEVSLEKSVDSTTVKENITNAANSSTSSTSNGPVVLKIANIGDVNSIISDTNLHSDDLSSEELSEVINALRSNDALKKLGLGGGTTESQPNYTLKKYIKSNNSVSLALTPSEPNSTEDDMVLKPVFFDDMNDVFKSVGTEKHSLSNITVEKIRLEVVKDPTVDGKEKIVDGAGEMQRPKKRLPIVLEEDAPPKEVRFLGYTVLPPEIENTNQQRLEAPNSSSLNQSTPDQPLVSPSTSPPPFTIIRAMTPPPPPPPNVPTTTTPLIRVRPVSSLQPPRTLNHEFCSNSPDETVTFETPKMQFEAPTNMPKLQHVSVDRPPVVLNAILGPSRVKSPSVPKTPEFVPTIIRKRKIVKTYGKRTVDGKLIVTDLTDKEKKRTHEMILKQSLEGKRFTPSLVRSVVADDQTHPSNKPETYLTSERPPPLTPLPLSKEQRNHPITSSMLRQYRPAPLIDLESFPGFKSPQLAPTPISECPTGVASSVELREVGSRHVEDVVDIKDEPLDYIENDILMERGNNVNCDEEETRSSSETSFVESLGRESERVRAIVNNIPEVGDDEDQPEYVEINNVSFTEMSKMLEEGKRVEQNKSAGLQDIENSNIPDLSMEEHQLIIGRAAKLLADPNVKQVVFTKNKKNVRKKLKLVPVEMASHMTQSITKYVERAAPKQHTAPPKKDDKNVCVLFTNFTSEGDYINDHDYLVNPYVRNKMFYYYRTMPVCECLICDFVHQSKDHIDHMKSHSTVCKVCGINFHNVFILNLHVRCHATYCSRCSEYISYAQREKHASLHVPEFSKNASDFRVDNKEFEIPDIRRKRPRILKKPIEEEEASMSVTRKSRRVSIRPERNDFAVEDTKVIGDNSLKPGVDPNLIPKATQDENGILSSLLCDESMENVSDEHIKVSDGSSKQSENTPAQNTQPKDVVASKKLDSSGKKKRKRGHKIWNLAKVKRLKMQKEKKLKNSSNKISNVSETDATKNGILVDKDIPELLGVEDPHIRHLPELPSLENISHKSKALIDAASPEENYRINDYLSEELRLRLKDINLNPYVYMENILLPFNAVALKSEELDNDYKKEEDVMLKKEEVVRPKRSRERKKGSNIANDTPLLQNEGNQDDSTVPDKTEQGTTKKTVNIKQNKEGKRNKSLDKNCINKDVMEKDLKPGQTTNTSKTALQNDSIQDDSTVPDKTEQHTPKKTVNIKHNKEGKRNKSLDKNVINKDVMEKDLKLSQTTNTSKIALQNDSIQDDSIIVPDKTEQQTLKKPVNIKHNKEGKRNKSLDKNVINKDVMENDLKPSQTTNTSKTALQNDSIQDDSTVPDKTEQHTLKKPVNTRQKREGKRNKSLDKGGINKDGMEKDLKPSPIAGTIKTRSSRSGGTSELLGGLDRIRKIYDRPKRTAKVGLVEVSSLSSKDVDLNKDLKDVSEPSERSSEVLEPTELKIEGSVPDVIDSQSKDKSDFGIQLKNHNQNQSVDELDQESFTMRLDRRRKKQTYKSKRTVEVGSVEVDTLNPKDVDLHKDLKDAPEPSERSSDVLETTELKIEGSVPDVIDSQSKDKSDFGIQLKNYKQNESVDELDQESLTVRLDRIRKKRTLKPKRTVEVGSVEVDCLNPKDVDLNKDLKDATEPSERSSDVLQTTELKIEGSVPDVIDSQSKDKSDFRIQLKNSKQNESVDELDQESLTVRLDRIRKKRTLKPKRTVEVGSVEVDSLNPKDVDLNKDLKDATEPSERSSDVLQTTELKIEGSVPDVIDSQSKNKSDFGVQLKNHKQNESVDELDQESLTVRLDRIRKKRTLKPKRIIEVSLVEVDSLNPKDVDLNKDLKDATESSERSSDVLETTELKIEGSVQDVINSQSKDKSDFGIQLKNHKQNESIDELVHESLTARLDRIRKKRTLKPKRTVEVGSVEVDSLNPKDVDLNKDLKDDPEPSERSSDVLETTELKIESSVPNVIDSQSKDKFDFDTQLKNHKRNESVVELDQESLPVQIEEQSEKSIPNLEKSDVELPTEEQKENMD